MAVGGIKSQNIGDYLDAGADGLALGGSIYSFERMKNRMFNEIQKDIEEFMFAVQGFYSKIKKNDSTNR